MEETLERIEGARHLSYYPCEAAKALALADTDRQSDTFHAVAHRLGLYARR